MSARDFSVRVAHASRVLANASRIRGLFLDAQWLMGTQTKVRFGGTPKPARETRALPGD